ncbi:AEC family transporter [Priestia megaterium]
MMQSVFSILFHAMLPLSIPVIGGALLAHFKNLETKPLLTLYLYFLTPAIIFDTLHTAKVSSNDVYMTLAFSILNLLLLWAVANIIGKILKLTSSEVAGLTLVSTFTNSVNYGLPLIFLVLGHLGLDKASVYVVIQMIIVNTIGIYFAARSQFSVKNAVKSVFSLPAIYAALFAIVLRYFSIPLPTGIEKGITMIAEAYSPVVLAILGAQMVRVKKQSLEARVKVAFWSGLFIRLLLSPLVALFCLYLLNIKGTLYSVLFILSCMPVAVNAVVLAEKFNASSKIVSKSILWTTLASFIVLPLLIVLIK